MSPYLPQADKVNYILNFLRFFCQKCSSKKNFWHAENIHCDREQFPPLKLWHFFTHDIFENRHREYVYLENTYILPLLQEGGGDIENTYTVLPYMKNI